MGKGKKKPKCWAVLALLGFTTMAYAEPAAKPEGPPPKPTAEEAAKADAAQCHQTLENVSKLLVNLASGINQANSTVAK